MTERTDRRSRARINVRWPTTIHVDDHTTEGEIRNITIEGMLIVCRETLRQDEVYRIAIKPSNYPAIEVMCRVVWSNIYPAGGGRTASGMGICFVKIDENDLDLLSEVASLYHK